MSPASDYSQQPSCSYSEYETDYPHLNAKLEKRTVKGRRSGVEQLLAGMGRHYGSITKVIDDPQRVLSQKRKNRLLKNCSDNMVCGVQYSLNRKNRWEIEPANLLENLESSKDVGVIVTNTDTLMNRYWAGFRHRCSAIHAMDKDGVVKTARAGGIGVSQDSLLKAGEFFESENESDSGELKPNVIYRIETQHRNNRVFFGRTEKRRNGKCGWRNIPRRNKMIDMSELELSEMENSVHLEDNETYKPSRDFKFSLGDFIDASNTVPVNIRRQSIESIKNIEEIDKDELPKDSRPYGLLDISPATKAENIYTKTSIPTNDWEAYNFCQQVDALSTDENIIVKWLDPSHLRASIDVSRKLGHNCERPEMIIVLDRCTRGSIGVLLNTTVHALGPMNANILKNILVHQKSGNVDDIVRILVNLLLQWKIRAHKSGSVTDAGQTEFVFKSAQTPILTKHGLVVSEFDMAEILRSEADNSEDEPFERISDDEFSSEEDSQGFETTIVGTIKIKCAICDHPNAEDLFEMDDCWQCISCARQNIMTQIKGKYLPIDAPFVTDADATPYDVLPAILPLTMFNFYTKVAALEILENSQDEINDLFECPTCCNVVKVERPHEYSSCCCSGCSTIWCLECKNEPHWPLSCSEYADWSDKWVKQYPNGLPINHKARFARKFRCDCRAIINVDDLNTTSVVCCHCHKTADATMMFIPPVSKYSVKKQREIRGERSLTDNELPIIRRPIQLIRKDIADICADARVQRYTKPKTKLMKAVRTYKNIPMGKIYDLRRTILLVVEYGLAKLYLTKKGPQGLKTSVLQLLRMLEELVADVEELKPTVGDSVKQLDAAVNKVIEQFKIIDLV